MLENSSNHFEWLPTGGENAGSSRGTVRHLLGPDAN